jgi:glycosyltransferase A (GT-A) superfamily protein (DUF2064 family)
VSIVNWTTVAVIAKQPIPGKVKTRLIGVGVTAEDAADLARAALRDTLDELAAMPVQHRTLILDGEYESWMSGWTIQRQVAGLLDKRLSAAFDGLPTGPAVLVGMDTPQLEARDLAIDGSGWDACLGPATDGGYWAIGFADPSMARSVISGVPMSRADTGAVQLSRMRQAGLRVALLPTLTDVDTALSAAEVAESCPDSRFAGAWRTLGAPVGAIT